MYLGEEKTSECLLFLFVDCERPDDLSVKNAPFIENIRISFMKSE